MEFKVVVKLKQGRTYFEENKKTKLLRNMEFKVVKLKKGGTYFERRKKRRKKTFWAWQCNYGLLETDNLFVSSCDLVMSLSTTITAKSMLL